jgi:triacylglycerol lipase
MFLINIVLDIFLYLYTIIRFGIDIRVLLVNLLILILILNIIFWSGIIRVYLCSKQLGVRYRLFGLILGLIPIAHLVMLILIIKVCKDEVSFENNKIKLNKSREKEEVCKTKYPIVLVHGIFFRDYEKLNYWGRIPDELVKNGATIYYGNHSSSLAIKDSAEELSIRIKEIIKETKCKKVNVIAHSKGGLDTRYAIANLGMDKYIASLTMINTPNHGCLFADYLMTKAPKKLKEQVAKGYNFTLRKLGDKSPDFIAGVTDLTHPETEKLNKIMPMSPKVYYQAYGSVLNHTTSSTLPLNLTGAFVKKFDGKNDGLVGIESFPIDKDFTLIETKNAR